MNFDCFFVVMVGICECYFDFLVYDEVVVFCCVEDD